MYRFLASLSIRNGPGNRTFHLLVAHYLQQAYPAVQDVNAAFSISSIAQGTFSFAPRTAIVVNLELMYEFQRLAAGDMLCAATFADAVLRSQPNYLVQALHALVDPQSAHVEARRAKLVAEGTGLIDAFLFFFFLLINLVH